MDNNTSNSHHHDTVSTIPEDTIDRTLALVLPDSLTRTRFPQIDAIIKLNDFEVIRTKKIWLTKQNVLDLFPDRFKDRDSVSAAKWVEYATSGPCIALDLKKDFSAMSWQIALGPLDAATQSPRDTTSTIRGSLAIDNVRVAAEGSDEPEQAVEQLNMIFSDKIPEISYDGYLMLPPDNSAVDVEYTLAMIKPDITTSLLQDSTSSSSSSSKVYEILTQIKNCGIEIVQERRVQFNRGQAEYFYAEHKGKPFFAGLVDFMTSGLSVVLKLRTDNAVKVWREIIGPTDHAVAKRDFPNSIRAKFGTSIQANAVHGSDSPESAARELEFFFKTPSNLFDELEISADAGAGAGATPETPKQDTTNNTNDTPNKPSSGGDKKKKNKRKRNKRNKRKQSVTSNASSVSGTGGETTPLSASVSLQNSDDEASATNTGSKNLLTPNINEQPQLDTIAEIESQVAPPKASGADAKREDDAKQEEPVVENGHHDKPSVSQESETNGAFEEKPVVQDNGTDKDVSEEKKEAGAANEDSIKESDIQTKKQIEEETKPGIDEEKIEAPETSEATEKSAVKEEANEVAEPEKDEKINDLEVEKQQDAEVETSAAEPGKIETQDAEVSKESAIEPPPTAEKSDKSTNDSTKNTQPQPEVEDEPVPELQAIEPAAGAKKDTEKDTEPEDACFESAVGPSSKAVEQSEAVDDSKEDPASADQEEKQEAQELLAYDPVEEAKEDSVVPEANTAHNTDSTAKEDIKNKDGDAPLDTKAIAQTELVDAKDSTDAEPKDTTQVQEETKEIATDKSGVEEINGSGAKQETDKETLPGVKESDGDNENAGQPKEATDENEKSATDSIESEPIPKGLVKTADIPAPTTTATESNQQKDEGETKEGKDTAASKDQSGESHAVGRGSASGRSSLVSSSPFLQADRSQGTPISSSRRTSSINRVMSPFLLKELAGSSDAQEASANTHEAESSTGASKKTAGTATPASVSRSGAIKERAALLESQTIKSTAQPKDGWVSTLPRGAKPPASDQLEAVSPPPKEKTPTTTVTTTTAHSRPSVKGLFGDAPKEEPETSATPPASVESPKKTTVSASAAARIPSTGAAAPASKPKTNTSTTAASSRRTSAASSASSRHGATTTVSSARVPRSSTVAKSSASTTAPVSRRTPVTSRVAAGSTVTKKPSDAATSPTVVRKSATLSRATGSRFTSTLPTTKPTAGALQRPNASSTVGRAAGARAAVGSRPLSLKPTPGTTAVATRTTASKATVGTTTPRTAVAPASAARRLADKEAIASRRLTTGSIGTSSSSASKATSASAVAKPRPGVSAISRTSVGAASPASRRVSAIGTPSSATRTATTTARKPVGTTASVRSTSAASATKKPVAVRNSSATSAATKPAVPSGSAVKKVPGAKPATGRVGASTATASRTISTTKPAATTTTTSTAARRVAIKPGATSSTTSTRPNGVAKTKPTSATTSTTKRPIVASSAVRARPTATSSSATKRPVGGTPIASTRSVPKTSTQPSAAKTTKANEKQQQPSVPVTPKKSATAAVPAPVEKEESKEATKGDGIEETPKDENISPVSNEKDVTTLSHPTTTSSPENAYQKAATETVEPPTTNEALD
ncbi:thioredoxin domain-containing protein 6 [Mycoemilia scoparia]|uniref:Nucleoside diphosphate kinase n=1 Tax=Mycoemilia scoparia TaxID=417184 RepID=A0A9W7ZZ09_9FUNG|nr:thioredoxin domain-containing protein 6 [Mycoemilia scoparia]